MIAGTRFVEFKEAIWVLASGHVGMASAILNFLDDKFRSLERRDLKQIGKLLWSTDLLREIV
ncbi:hypothetical protein HDV03_003071, partial [Kappamyces sp. JEL0829]